MDDIRTYMLRLYTDSAADRILINYLDTKKNKQQYIRQLIENDIQKENILTTIREVMEEYFSGRVISPNIVPDTSKIDETSKEEINLPNFSDMETMEIQDDDESDVASITPDAINFLNMLGDENND
ncbi:hypothetical protein H8S00_01830 [Eubacterium sp. BX4]|uniref:Uncharacterized protein n=1 Tax=Eubacterium segne TaxID=2763045 RepID=A0ABR7EZI1_9FIRM|nr:hypothetical protein [Eubacterium segne]MBC5666736.1 hypothetical protein [Eubacterium segne]